MLETDTHIYFWGGYLSQWFKSRFNAYIDDYFGHVTFETAEQYMMFMKAHVFKDKKAMLELMSCSDPKKCKEIGRRVQGFDQEIWDKVSFDIVVNGNFHKFQQNFILYDKLYATGDKILVEASPYDRIWGVGLKEDDPRILDDKNWLGENRLGKALMSARTMLKQFGSPKGRR